MERDLIEKLAQAVRTAEENGDHNLSRRKIIAAAMDEHRIPDDSRNLRSSYEFAVLKRLEAEQERAEEEEIKKRRAAENRENKLREEVLARPSVTAEKTTELALDDEFTDALLKGEISKEDLDNSRYEYRGKNPRNFYFGPPR